MPSSNKRYLNTVVVIDGGGRGHYSYVLEKIFEAFEIFNFIQKHANLSDIEMYSTFNMGNDYALFVGTHDVDKALKIISKSKFKGLDAGFVENGEKRVVIKSKNINFNSKSLDLR